MIAALLVAVPAAHAYVGPGAGFGMVTSFVVFLNAIAASLLSLLLWPVGLLLRRLRMRRRELPATAGRVVVLGLDGLSPSVASELMEAGEMPNLRRLAESGCFGSLRTTSPGISPVAWSSFQTGVNPGRHAIFDFLAPDRSRYLPVLSSVKTGTTERERRIGPLRLSGSRSYVRLLRRSRPFWTLLGRYGLRSVVLRVPITYPPEELDGHLLSGMCVPDVRGTQGSYTLFVPEGDEGDAGGATGGLTLPLSREGDSWRGTLPGPPAEGGTESLPVYARPLRRKRSAWRLGIGSAVADLEPGELSPWLELEFGAGRGKVRAIALARLTLDDAGRPLLYVSALNVAPSKPAVPVSHPVHYSRYLAGMQGPFATLGLAEDTWALTNGAIDEPAFLSMCWRIFDERRRMWTDALSKVRRGLVACVFDTSDRIQHMFWADGTGEGSPVREMYRRMDELVGETVGRLRRDDMLVVMSDHGFTSFHTCVDLNRWLVERGYMVLEEGVDEVSTGFRGVDWSRTVAWSMGLAGIMLNLRGREGEGTVEPGEEAERLLEAISSELLELRDGDGGRVVRSASRASEVYEGPYAGDGPDLVVGMERGYRTGWGCVTGGVGRRVLYPNDHHWNGDHCHDSRLVPGVIASDRELDLAGASILDVAPTVLEALGVRPPSYMDGRSLHPGEGAAG